MTDVTPPRTEVDPIDRTACVFVPRNEPWMCTTHLGGIRTRLDEPQCDIARPAEPFNAAYLQNVREAVSDGKRIPGHYIIRRLLATLDAAPALLRDADDLGAALDEAERDLPGCAEKGGDFTDGAEWVLGRIRYALGEAGKVQR